MRVIEKEVETPSGEVVQRESVSRIRAVAVAAVDDTCDPPEIILERQYRAAIDAWTLEIVAGRRDRDDESSIECAHRELREEAGVRVRELRPLTNCLITPGWSDEQVEIFLGLGLSDAEREHDGAEEEHMVVERVALTKIPKLIADGELRDAKSIIGCLLAMRHFGL